MYKILTSSLLEIAAVNAEGFTVDAKTLQPITNGYAVALAATQDSFGEAGLNHVISFVQKLFLKCEEIGPYKCKCLGINRNLAFGGWLNTDNGQFYFDATVICETQEEAEALARANKQIAYFDLSNLKEVRI